MTCKFFQNVLFNMVWPETTITVKFAIKICIDSTAQTSSESLIHAKSKTFLILILSCKSQNCISFCKHGHVYFVLHFFRHCHRNFWFSPFVRRGPSIFVWKKFTWYCFGGSMLALWRCEKNL